MTFLGSCTITPEPLTDSFLSKSANEDRTLMFNEDDQIIGNLSLEEAIARAVKYNLEHRAKAMEQALALNQLDLDDYQLLPSLTAKAGYSDRSEFSASTSQQLDGLPPSSHFSYSGDRTSFTGDLKLSWNFLDFGVSYFNARQNADRSLIADERRKKVLNNLIREVQFAYWRMVAAQKLKGRVKKALVRAEKALFDAEKVEKEKLRPPTEMLRYQKRLVNNIRRLETVNQELSTARIELASLINVSPSTDFKIAAGPTDDLTVPTWQVPLEKMELLAFQNNPDIRERLYLNRIGVDNAKKSLLQLLPGINLTGGRNYDLNSFLDKNRWYEWSSTLSLNVLKFVSFEDQKRFNDATKTVSEAQRLSLRMAILAQVHVADRQFFNAVKQFQRSDKLFAIDKRLSAQIAQRQVLDIQSLLDRISQETAAIDSLMRRYQSYAEVIVAFGRIQSTLGISIFSKDIKTKNLKDLTRIVGQSLSDATNGVTIKAELDRVILNNTENLNPISHPEVANTQDLDSNIVVVENPDMSPPKKSVTVSLNQLRAGGDLKRAKILCETIYKLNSHKGWVKISAEDFNKRKVEGWLHKVYGNTLALQCGKKGVVEIPELVDKIKDRLNTITIENPDTIETPDINFSGGSVKVFLNEFRAAGTLTQTEVQCGTISKVNSDQGWVKITAKSSKKQNVEGWLHEVYGTMLASQCNTTIPAA